MYKPLPSSVTIKQSNIEGLGLVATQKLNAESFIGIGWIKDPQRLAENGVWRTPLGGFVNHSDTPNCIKLHEDNPSMEFIFLHVGDKDIEPGEELTVRYTFYNV